MISICLYLKISHFTAFSITPYKSMFPKVALKVTELFISWSQKKMPATEISGCRHGAWILNTQQVLNKGCLAGWMGRWKWLLKYRNAKFRDYARHCWIPGIFSLFYSRTLENFLHSFPMNHTSWRKTLYVGSPTEKNAFRLKHGV